MLRCLPRFLFEVGGVLSFGDMLLRGLREGFSAGVGADAAKSMSDKSMSDQSSHRVKRVEDSTPSSRVQGGGTAARRDGFSSSRRSLRVPPSVVLGSAVVYGAAGRNLLQGEDSSGFSDFAVRRGAVGEIVSSQSFVRLCSSARYPVYRVDSVRFPGSEKADIDAVIITGRKVWLEDSKNYGAGVVTVRVEDRVFGVKDLKGQWVSPKVQAVSLVHRSVRGHERRYSNSLVVARAKLFSTVKAMGGSLQKPLIMLSNYDCKFKNVEDAPLFFRNPSFYKTIANNSAPTDDVTEKLLSYFVSLRVK